MYKIIMLVGFLFFNGCTTVDIVYPVIKPMKELKLLEKGVYVRSCMLKSSQIPKVYILEKKNFSLYIINSDVEFPKVYLGAKDKNGKVLTIKIDNGNNGISYSLNELNILERLDTLDIDYSSIEDKERNIYGITNVCNLTKTLPITNEELTTPRNKVKLYLYDKNKKKVGEVQLKFELKSTSCKGAIGL